MSSIGTGPQGPLSWFRFGGVEIGNAARVLSYLQNGLGLTAHWELGTGDLCPVLYKNELGVPVVYSSPAADPAPWYDVTEPGSSRFLGVVVTKLTGYDGTGQRTISPRIAGLQGGVFMQQRRKPRAWKFEVAIVAQDDTGAEYGLRWLTSVLNASACDGCDTTELEVRLVCPPADGSNDGLGHWTSPDAALVDGPTETMQWSPGYESMADILAGCRTFTLYEFEIDAGNPYLYKPIEGALGTSLVSAPGVACEEILAYPGGFYLGAVPFAGNMFEASMTDTAWVAQVQGDAPILWYRMDVLAGVTEDDVGSLGSDGTYHGFPTFDQPGATPSSPAVLFQKALNQYLLGADADGYSIVQTGGLSVEWWSLAQVAADPAIAERMVSKFSTSANGREWIGERYATGEYAFRVFPAVSNTPLAHATFGHPPLGVYHHHVATIGSSGGLTTVKTYLDGVPTDTQSFVGGDYFNTILADAPRGYWRLNESSGLVFADSSGHGHNSSVGHPTITYGAQGAVVKAIVFHTAGCIEIADTADLDLGDVMTLECWITPAVGAVSDVGWESLIDKGTGAYTLGYNSTTHQFRFQQSNGTVICTATTTVPIDANVHHLVATKNGTAVHLYLNGVDVTGVVTNATLTDTATSLTLAGTTGGGGPRFEGTMCEAAVYATELSAARVLAHYTAANIRNTASRVEVSGSDSGNFPFNGTLDEVLIYDHVLTPARVAAHFESVQPPLCVEVTPPTLKSQTLGAIFTFESTTGAGSVSMKAYSNCPQSGLETPELTLRLRAIPANSTVIVDCAQRSVTVETTDPASGEVTVYDGQYLLLPTGGTSIDPVQWIEARECDDLTCFCVSVDDPCTYAGDTFVSIDTQLREG